MGSNIWTWQMYLMFHRSKKTHKNNKKRRKKILYALYYSWENNRFGNETWKCQGEGVRGWLWRRHAREPNIFLFVHVLRSCQWAYFWIYTMLKNKTREKIKTSWKLIVKNAFFHMTPVFYSVYTFILCAAPVTNKCTMNIVKHWRRYIMSRQS